MANRRIINCDIFEDEWYGQLDFFEQQLWIGLFSRMADDQGRLLDNPILIGRYIFLYKSIDPEKVDKALAGFHNDGKIIRYENGGKKLIQIKRWWENQRPQWASPSNFDPPENWADKIRTRINGKYFVENWGSAEDSHSSPERAPERAPEDDKKDLSARHVPVPVPVPVPGPVPVPDPVPVPGPGPVPVPVPVPGPVPGPVPVPDPVPVPVPVPDINASAANFFSKFQSILGPLGGNKQVDTLKDLLKELGEQKILEMAQWLADRGETSMYKALRTIQTKGPTWVSGGPVKHQNEGLAWLESELAKSEEVTNG